jgi:hypothetical protein
VIQHARLALRSPAFSRKLTAEVPALVCALIMNPPILLMGCHFRRLTRKSVKFADAAGGR